MARQQFDQHQQGAYRYTGDPYKNEGKKPKKDNDVGNWIFIGVMLLAFTPLGILLLVLKLSNGNTGRKRGPVVNGTYSGNKHQTHEHRGARTTGSATGNATADELKKSAQDFFAQATDMKDQFVNTMKSDEMKKTMFGQENTKKEPVKQTKQEAKKAAKQESKPKEQTTTTHRIKIKTGKPMIIVGGIMSALFGFISIVLTITLLTQAQLVDALVTVTPLLCFFTGGLALLWSGLSQRKRARKYRQYLAMIGTRRNIAVSTLADATRRSSAAVCKDLEDMLDDGLFPGGYLNYGGEMLVVSGEGLQDAPVEEKPSATPFKKADEENSVLAEIRAVSQDIDNEKLSDQVERIGVITAKIFEYQKANPDKSVQLHTFLSYYLPTTLKILRAYVQLEDQEVSGTNITTSMTRIEGMMEKVVEGFEKQLDQLFQHDAMDITSEVQVLERMLAKDGLSGSLGMQMER